MLHECTIQGVIFRPLTRISDARGWLVELYREDELAEANHPCMTYVSETLPGVTRGPHEHRYQSDLFAFVGPSDFHLHLWDRRADSPTCGHEYSVVVGESNPQSVIIPPGVVHAYSNVSQKPGWVFNAPNRLYQGEGKQEPVDEIRHEDLPSSAYSLE